MNYASRLRARDRNRMQYICRKSAAMLVRRANRKRIRR